MQGISTSILKISNIKEINNNIDPRKIITCKTLLFKLTATTFISINQDEDTS